MTKITLTNKNEETKNDIIKVGNIYKHRVFTGTLYLLTQVGRNRVCLVSIDSFSNRYNDPIWVQNTSLITKEEFSLIACGSDSEFTLVESVEIVVRE